MTLAEAAGAMLAAALGGGVGVRLLDRFWNTKDSGKKEAASLKKLQIDGEAKIREELREVEAQLREELRRVEKDEASWRTKFWEGQGAKQALETELHTMRPRFIELIQQNQALIAQVETLKRLEGRRREDKQSGFQVATNEALDRIEAAGAKAVEHTEKVARDLALSQDRADAIEGEAGEAADAASRSSNGE